MHVKLYKNRQYLNAGGINFCTGISNFNLGEYTIRHAFGEYTKCPAAGGKMSLVLLLTLLLAQNTGQNKMAF